MLMEWWDRQVGWRFKAHGAALRHLHRVLGRDRRAARVQGKRCTTCGARCGRKYAQCVKCRRKARDWMRHDTAAKKAQALEDGRCTNCYGPNPDAGKFKMCPPCRTRARQDKAAWKARQKAADTAPAAPLAAGVRALNRSV